MTLYSKRIAFMISDQHFIPHGGIGSFARTFFEMCEELNWRCDFILDKKPRESILLNWCKDQKAQIYYPENQQTYNIHQLHFVFSDTLNFEKVINFRNSLFKAFSHHIYDAVITNTPEATPAAYVLDIHKHIPVIFYTHNENLIFMNTKKSDVFNEAFDNISKGMMSWDGITIATQSQKNADAIQQNLNKIVYSLPMRVPERNLLNSNPDWDKKEGMLFIGRHEPRKNPEAFVDIAAKTGIKPLVLTNKTGKEKFEVDFKTAGITDFDIRAGIIGQEKVDFIKSARIAFHPSKLESYGFSAFESLHSCPTFALKEYDWYNGFNGLVPGLSKSECVETLLNVYKDPAQYYDGILEKLNEIDKNIPLQWKTFLENFKPKIELSERETKVLTIIKEGQFSVYDLYTKGLKRKAVAADDIQSVLSKRHLTNVYHTVGKTYLSMSDFKEPEKDIFDQLFD